MQFKTMVVALDRTVSNDFVSLCLGCNIVDIGANDGDSALILAVAARGGTVVAFEMGTAIDMLRVNKRYVTFCRHAKGSKIYGTFS